ncbi:hypothetical protein [Streptomyces sp. NPDC045251]|uniref:hypothetical protein n=1 Tax=unclassified Streptomyces TaxID=2593676 RepID=UPI00340E2473
MSHIGRQPLFTWIIPGGGAVCFHWDAGQVTLSGAHAPDVDTTALADLAAELTANLVGDDGEHDDGVLLRRMRLLTVVVRSEGHAVGTAR